MTVSVKREQLLSVLESCQPGLANREILEQTTCFIFHDGDVITYNDELICRMKSPLGKSIEGAAQAEKFLEILRKRQEEDLFVTQTDSDIVLKYKSRESEVRTEKELHLLKSIQAIESPGEWKKLPDDFGDAVGTVQSAAGRDNNNFALTCVHVGPKWVEASDLSQMCRWTMDTGFTQDILVRRNAVKHIASMGMNAYSETASWVHFKNARGLVMSCRRYTDVDDFPALDQFLTITGKELELNGKGLADAVEMAKIFVSPEGEDNDHVSVELRTNQLRLVGQGPQGRHREKKKVKWDGQNIQFFILPDLLIDLVRKHSQFSITDDSNYLIVDSGSYRYLTCLSKLADNSNGNGEEKEEKSEEDE